MRLDVKNLCLINDLPKKEWGSLVYCVLHKQAALCLQRLWSSQ